MVILLGNLGMVQSEMADFKGIHWRSGGEKVRARAQRAPKSVARIQELTREGFVVRHGANGTTVFRFDGYCPETGPDEGSKIAQKHGKTGAGTNREAPYFQIMVLEQ